MENAPDTTKIEKLPHSLTITMNGESKTVFMSFALLNQLSILVGDPEQIPQVHMNPQLRQEILQFMLAERTKGGRIVNQVDIGDCEVSLDDIEYLLDFASAHILDFLLRVAEKSSALMLKSKDRITTLQSTLTGQAN